MRNGRVQPFISTMDWETLSIGPQSAMDPDEKQELKEAISSNESTYDL